LQNHAPLRKSEGATLFLDGATPIKMFHPQSLIFINFVHQYRLTAQHTLPFFRAEPDFLKQCLPTQTWRGCQADFEVGDGAMGCTDMTGGLYRQLRGRNY